MSLPKILAVVVSYENPQLTIACVESLIEQTVPVDVVIWDNNSSEATKQALSEYEFPGCDEVPIVFCSENLLWAPAVNRAFEAFMEGESYEYLIMSNNDIILHQDAVNRMVREMELDGSIGIIGPMGTDAGHPWDRHKPQDVQANMSTEVIAAGGDFELLNTIVQNYAPKRVTYVLGAWVMVRASAWEEVGPLDEKLALSADDHDYSIRMKNNGYKCMVAQSTVAVHFHHSSGAVSDKWSTEGPKAWAWFDEKYKDYWASEDERERTHFQGWYDETIGDVGTGWDLQT